MLQARWQGLCSLPKGHSSRPRKEVVDEHDDTAFETYDSCPARMYVDRSIFCTGSPWIPQLGIQSRGFDTDHALCSSPTQALFGDEHRIFANGDRTRLGHPGSAQ